MRSTCVYCLFCLLFLCMHLAQWFLLGIACRINCWTVKGYWSLFLLKYHLFWFKPLNIWFCIFGQMSKSVYFSFHTHNNDWKILIFSILKLIIKMINKNHSLFKWEKFLIIMFNIIKRQIHRRRYQLDCFVFSVIIHLNIC